MALNAQERQIYWTSFAVRCFFGLTAWWIINTFQIPLAEDPFYYKEMGQIIAREWWQYGTSPTLQWAISADRPWLIFVIIAGMTIIMGDFAAVPVLIVLFSFITSLAPVYTYRIAKELEIMPRAALFSARLVVFSPAFAFWGGFMAKDALVFIVMNLIVYHVLILQKKRRFKSILGLTLAMLALLILRFYLATLLIPILALTLLLKQRRQRYSLKVSPGGGGIGLTQIVVILVVFALFTLAGVSKGIQRAVPESMDHFLQDMQDARNDAAARGESGYLRGADISTPKAAIRYLPVGVFYFLTVPHPWRLGSFRNNLAIIETLFWVLMYPAVLMGMRRGLRRNYPGAVLLIVIILAKIFLYSLASGNAGTAYRMRSQVWLFFAIFIGWYREKRYLQKIRKVSMVGRPTTAGESNLESS